MNLIFLFLVFNIFLVRNSDEFKTYQKAFDYIIQDTTSIDSAFTEYISVKESRQICLSSQVVFFSKVIFVNDIIEYEYECLNVDSKKKLKNILIANEKYETFPPFYNDDLIKLNVNSDCKLRIFFSKITDNKLIAEVVLAYKDFNEYEKNIVMSPVFLSYLFYFDESGITKVFSKKAYQ